MIHPECDRLRERLDEWNAIFPFIEWLQEQIPILQNLEDLLYEYFDMDPAELERKRREILESLREDKG